MTHIYGSWRSENNLEIPDGFRAKSVAAERWSPAPGAHHRGTGRQASALIMPGKPWMTAFGKLRQPRIETAKINRIKEEEFEQIEAESL
jgi:hypothetical protein